MTLIDYRDPLDQLPPETHMRMALDYLFVQARRMRLGVTATLIAAAADAVLKEAAGPADMGLAIDDGKDLGRALGSDGFAEKSGNA